MKRIRLQPSGERFKRKVEEWLRSLTDGEFDLLAARRDRLVAQLEELYRSVDGETMGWQS